MRVSRATQAARSATPSRASTVVGGVDRRGCTRRRGLSRGGHAGGAERRHEPRSERALDKGSSPHVAIF